MKTIRLHLVTSLALASWLIAPAVAQAMPTAGSNELRIDSSYLIPGYSISGFNHHSMSTSGTTSYSDSQTVFGLGFAYGRFLSDHFEIGSSLTLLYIESGGSSATAPGIAPFLRGFTVVSERAAFYGAVVVGLQYVSDSTDTSITEMSVGFDLGFELFPADSWSLRIGPTYRYINEDLSGGGASASAHDNVFGVNWALAGYF
jgi:hypothetical protein